MLNLRKVFINKLIVTQICPAAKFTFRLIGVDDKFKKNFYFNSIFSKKPTLMHKAAVIIPA